ncbi:hypothetical protein GWC77_20415 [Paraburkholderia sp. NMBU_R16]|uniref:cupredoxin domain-containing protein n=1 Tax=Paraburkholderia sp. NMBU_R16 TaxID=2698676 RepID=UPI0015668BD9|nr:cupredoxin family copper-binding protein [Paraburkholderia sp. NMBU_R16]NRO98292.1 hypothetical protein [Paraburkholderia sp. NMBU_R16]
MSSNAWLARAALSAAAAVCLLLGTHPASAAEHIVTIEGMQFSPASVTVQAGDEIVWVNKDLVAHTATATGRFDSRTIEPGHRWRYVARAPGTYPYGCTLHPTMKATLIVEKGHERRNTK